MTQMRLRDFFKVEAPKSGTRTPVELTYYEPEENDRNDNISFHSFTVYKSMDTKDKLWHKGTSVIGTDQNPASSDCRVTKQRKISDFNEYLLDKELGSLNTSQPPPDRPNGKVSPPSQIPEITRAFNRQPFNQLQLKTVQQPQPQISKPKKLDDYFKAQCIVDKEEAHTLGKRKGSNMEDENRPVLAMRPSKKYRPMDNFVKKIRRNTPATCCFMRLGTQDISRVMHFLTLTENAKLSKVCNFFYQCFRGLWFNTDFFNEMDLSKLSCPEIRKIQQKSKLPHNQIVLGSLFRGKNLDIFLKRNRVAFASAPAKSSKKGLISKFELSPLKPSGRLATQNTMVVDKDLTKILETSYRTLTYCNLVSCLYISASTFTWIAKARSLQWLTISHNPNLNDTSAIEIMTNCEGLIHLDFSNCKQLTEKTTDAIVENLRKLESLNLSCNSQMISNFRNTLNLKSMTSLIELDISGCDLTDSKLISLCRNLPVLKLLSVEGCLKLTLEGLNQLLLHIRDLTLAKIDLSKTMLEKNHQKDLQKLEEIYKDHIELVYHRE